MAKRGKRQRRSKQNADSATPVSTPGNSTRLSADMAATQCRDNLAQTTITDADSENEGWVHVEDVGKFRVPYECIPAILPAALVRTHEDECAAIIQRAWRRKSFCSTQTNRRHQLQLPKLLALKRTAMWRRCQAATRTQSMAAHRQANVASVCAALNWASEEPITAAAAEVGQQVWHLNNGRWCESDNG